MAVGLTSLPFVEIDPTAPIFHTFDHLNSFSFLHPAPAISPPIHITRILEYTEILITLAEYVQDPEVHGRAPQLTELAAQRIVRYLRMVIKVYKL